MIRRLAVVSLHTSPLTQPGQGDSGGMNVYVRELCGAAARQGLDVDVFVRRDDHDLPSRVDVEPGLVVHYLDAGPVDMAKEELPGILDEFTDALIEHLAPNPPDAIHGHYWLSGEVAHRVKHHFDIPLLMTFHTLGHVKKLAGDAEPEARIEAEHRIVGCSDVILANARAERDQLVDLYDADPDRVQIVSPGIDRALFSPGGRNGAREALGIGPSPRMLFVGRIQPLKGLDVAVRSMCAMKNRDVRLSVVGGPSGREGAEYLAEVQGLAQACGVDDRIDWHEPQPHHQLSTWYRAADVVVMPSRSESFGLVALEAAACGTPVVATAVGGLRSLIRHGETGFLVEGREPKDHAAAIDRILASPELATRLSVGASTMAERNTWSSSAARLRTFLADLVGREPVSLCA